VACDRGGPQVGKQQHLYEPSGSHGLVLEHQHGRSRQPSMTQACLPVWTKATDPGVLPRHDPDVLVQTTDDHAKQSVRDNQQGTSGWRRGSRDLYGPPYGSRARSFAIGPMPRSRTIVRPTALRDQSRTDRMPCNGPGFAVSPWTRSAFCSLTRSCAAGYRRTQLCPRAAHRRGHHSTGPDLVGLDTGRRTGPACGWCLRTPRRCRRTLRSTRQIASEERTYCSTAQWDFSKQVTPSGTVIAQMWD
jgi:hypothetical protein